MTSHQLALVQSSWEHVLSSADLAVDLFHTELFRIDPVLRELFEPRLAAQRRVLVPGLSILVENLGDPAALGLALQQLRRLQVAHDLQLASPADLRDALVGSLQDLLGPLCPAETAKAWTAACAVIAQALRGSLVAA